MIIDKEQIKPIIVKIMSAHDCLMDIKVEPDLRYIDEMSEGRDELITLGVPKDIAEEIMLNPLDTYLKVFNIPKRDYYFDLGIKSYFKNLIDNE